MIALLIDRIKTYKQKYGYLSGLKYVAVRVYLKILAKFRLVFNDRNYIWVCYTKPNLIAVPKNVSITSYRKTEEIPEHALRKIIEEKGAGAIEWLNKEFSENSVLWLLYLDGEFVVRQFIRHGRFFDKWFLPLEDQDFVFLAAGTFPEYRGRGLNPLLKRLVMLSEMQTGGKAFVDCKVWNKPAIRALEKNNFKYLCEMKNYWEGTTLKDRISTLMTKMLK